MVPVEELGFDYMALRVEESRKLGLQLGEALFRNVLIVRGFLEAFDVLEIEEMSEADRNVDEWEEGVGGQVEEVSNVRPTTEAVLGVQGSDS